MNVVSCALKFETEQQPFKDTDLCRAMCKSIVGAKPLTDRARAGQELNVQTKFLFFYFCFNVF